MGDVVPFDVHSHQRNAEFDSVQPEAEFRPSLGHVEKDKQDHAGSEDEGPSDPQCRGESKNHAGDKGHFSPSLLEDAGKGGDHKKHEEGQKGSGEDHEDDGIDHHGDHLLLDRHHGFQIEEIALDDRYQFPAPLS